LWQQFKAALYLKIFMGKHQQLLANDLIKILSNKTIYGDYVGGYKFITQSFSDGKMAGINNVGSHNFGKWEVDKTSHTLKLTWDNGWDTTTTKAYYVDGDIKFYDTDTFQYRNTFTTIIDGIQDLKL
jgi:hypothetical protein